MNNNKTINNNTRSNTLMNTIDTHCDDNHSSNNKSCYKHTIYGPLCPLLSCACPSDAKIDLNATHLPLPTPGDTYVTISSPQEANELSNSLKEHKCFTCKCKKEEVSYVDVNNINKKDKLTPHSKLFLYSNTGTPLEADCLLDTGSPINLISASVLEKGKVERKFFKNNTKYTACNNNTLQIPHYTFLKVKLDNCKKWKLIKVYVCKGLAQSFILGLEGLHAFGYTLNITHDDLEEANDTHDGPPVCATTAIGEKMKLDKQERDVFVEVVNNNLTPDVDKFNSDTLPTDIPESLSNLLNKYKDVWPDTLPKDAALVEEFSIEFKEDASPFHMKPYKLSYAQKLALDCELAKLIDLGVIFNTNCKFLSPIVMVKKSDDSFRLCVDFRRLNAMTKLTKLVLPNMDDVLCKMHNKKVFSTLDLRSSFWQIGVEDATQQYLGFSSHRGNFCWRRMPFGLANATNHMQTVMMKVLEGLDFCSIAYVDDIIIFSDNMEQHTQHLELILKRLKKFKLAVKLEKCAFVKDSVSFLGYTFSSNGVTPSDKKLEEIYNAPTPTNVKHIKSFLGLCSFFRRFIPNYTDIIKPLQSLLKKGAKFVWNQEQEYSFSKLKLAFKESNILSFPDFNKDFHLYCDASDNGIGSVLCQINDDGSLRIIAFYSKALDATQCNYHINEKEVYSVLSSVIHFEHYILGHNTTIYTDNMSVKWLLEKGVSSKLYRWSLILQSYNLTCVHVRGEFNTVADFLSRFSPSVLNGTNVCSVQTHVDPFNDATLKRYLRHGMDKHLSLKQQNTLRHKAKNYTMVNDVLHHNGRVVPDPSIRERLTDDAHLAGGHCGVFKTSNILLQDYWWPSLHKTVKECTSNCSNCLSYGQKRGNCVTKHVKQHLHAHDVWDIVSFDLTEICYEKDGAIVADNLLTCIDLVSRWPEAIEVNDLSGVNIAKTLWKEVFSRYSFPRCVLSDNDPKFINSVFREMAILSGCKHLVTQGYAPWTNGDIEQMHSVFKEVLKKFLEGKASLWRHFVQAALFALRVTPSVMTAEGLVTPLYLLTGKHTPLIPKLLQTSNATETPTTDELLKAVNDRVDRISALTNLIHPEVAFLRKERLGADTAADEQQNVDPLPGGTVVLLLKPTPHNQPNHAKWANKCIGFYRIKSRLPKGGYMLETMAGEELSKPTHPSRLRRVGAKLAKTIVDGSANVDSTVVDFDKPEYTVERVTAHRVKSGNLEYKIKWKNFLRETWNKEEDTLPGACDAVAEYWQNLGSSSNVIAAIRQQRVDHGNTSHSIPSDELLKWLLKETRGNLDLDLFARDNNTSPLCKAGLEDYTILVELTKSKEMTGKILWCNPPFKFYVWLIDYLVDLLKNTNTFVYLLVPEMYLHKVEELQVLSVVKVPKMNHTYKWPDGTNRTSPPWSSFLVHCYFR